MKHWVSTVVVVVAGAVLGSFLGGFLATMWPSGKLHNLLAQEYTAGLHPTDLNLRVVDVTFGFLLHLNLLSIVGVLVAAFLYKKVFS